MLALRQAPKACKPSQEAETAKNDAAIREFRPELAKTAAFFSSIGVGKDCLSREIWV